MTTADHWKVWHSAGYVNAAVQAATADAVMTVQCSLEDKSVGLYVDPKAKLTGTRNDRTIIMRLDAGAPEQLDWITGPELYAIRNQDLGFVEVIEELKAARRTVEFVVSDSGKETMRHRFTLAEAATSIDAVFAACK